MSKSGDFREYPKILKIENDGRIIALDKHGRVNSQFYTNTITDEDSIKVFGLKFKLLYHDYVNDNLSRVEKIKIHIMKIYQQEIDRKITIMNVILDVI
ncbi:TPA: hypothetical protein ACF9DN_003113 [Staphylococcus aureus]|nr:hypothetical protein [Staphylococcus aureus]HDE7320613.1 hypothetical protein [Staphylococcus aureus]HDF0016681.1 hypothetical protein [Staphylococcus aureus]HDF0017676.1 hypothetical protein [Staphylococcus aureus]HDF0280744.1 hypothetical protein [Staphylococcus aureus]